MTTVGELKAALEGIADDVEVSICLTRHDRPLPIQEIAESHETDGPLRILLHCDEAARK
jgi:hypothetical protein